MSKNITFDINEEQIIITDAGGYIKEDTGLVVFDRRSNILVSFGNYKNGNEFIEDMAEKSYNLEKRQLIKLQKTNLNQDDNLKLMSENYTFTFPLMVTEFDPELSAKLLGLNSQRVRSACKHKFYHKIDYTIKYSGYCELDNDLKSIFQKKLKKYLPKSRSIQIISNENKIFL